MHLQAQYQQTDHHNDLSTSKPEFGLTIELHRHEIQSHDDNEHDGDPDCNVDVVRPIIDHEAGGRDFIGYENAESVPVEIAQSEAEGTGDIAISVVGHGAAVNGKIGCHLGHGGDNAVDEECHDDVGYEDEGGTA